MKIRIKFRKYGIMKFIGHLDIMRYFQKAMRRADIDICYSAGFSPHMIMSFASPLGVGLTSDGEYLDIEIGNELSSEAAVKRLNRVMADGVRFFPSGGSPRKNPPTQCLWWRLPITRSVSGKTACLRAASLEMAWRKNGRRSAHRNRSW